MGLTIDWVIAKPNPHARCCLPAAPVHAVEAVANSAVANCRKPVAAVFHRQPRPRLIDYLIAPRLSGRKAQRIVQQIGQRPAQHMPITLMCP
jgi:hypothetical protein